MKKLHLLFVILLFNSSILFSQVAINTDGNAAANSAMLDVKSTSKGFLPPRMTHAELNAISNPVDGLLVYCTDCGTNGTSTLSMFTAGSWYSLSANCINPLPPVTGTHVASSTQIVWNWNAVTGATGYKWNTANDYSTATDMGTVTAKTETGLACGTAYTRYVWAYSACGNSISLALSQTASACAGAPTVSTTAVTAVTQTTATSGGNVTDDGGATVTARGVCWSTTANPTTASSKTTDAGTTGIYTSSITGLTAGTTYYVRAYATNSAGTGYGSEVNFTTTSNAVTVTDIDGNVYNTVTIGTQVWMAENLKTTKYRNGDAIPNVTDNTAWAGLTTGAYCNYNNDAANAVIYGKLYNWYAATDTRNIAPTGWHVPTDAEWTTLTTYLGGETIAGGKLKEAGTSHWHSPNTGATNETGFTALPGGSRNYYNGIFYLIGNFGNWWSSTEDSTSYAWYRCMYYSYSSVGRANYYKQNGYSVRCVRDDNVSSVVVPTVSTTAVSAVTQTNAISGANVTVDGGAAVTARGVCWSTIANPITANNKTTDGTGTGSVTSSISGLTAGTTYYVRAYATNSAGTAYGDQVSFTTTTGVVTVTDIDGNVYATVTIGTQVWMAENLKTTKYRNGDAIPNVTDNTAWAGLTTGAYCNYNNDAANAVIYGKLYNWYAATDTRNIAPTGWHVPTDAEWTTLTTNLGGEDIAGEKLKETGFSHWANPNTGATNETGFTALPGGYRYFTNGTFGNIGFGGNWWSSTENSTTYAWYRYMYYSTSSVTRGYYSKQSGYSVRCVRDF